MVATADSIKRRTPRPERIVEGMARGMKAARTLGDRYRAVSEVEEAFERGHLTLEDLSIRHMFEQLVPHGREILRAWELNDLQQAAFLQEADAVKTSDFAPLMRAVLSGETMRQYAMADFLHDRLVRTIRTNLERERIPGIGGIGDKSDVINEGDPYPYAGVGAEWVDTPATQKRGMIVPLTREAVFFDRTSLIRERCSQVSRWLRVNKEKRVIGMVVGNTNNYHYKDRTYNTYQNGGAGELYDNIVGSNPFTNWQSVNAVKIQASKLTDPMTGEPIMLGDGTVVLGAPELEADFTRVFGAREVRQTDGSTVTISNNPIGGMQTTTMVSPYVRDIQGNADDWYMGIPTEAFGYLENWAITVVTAGAGSHEDFHRDIVLQFKASERGVVFVLNGRFFFRSTN